MLPLQQIVLSEVCQVVDQVPFGTSARAAQPEQVLVGRAMALAVDAVTDAAIGAASNWHDWLCYQIMAGLWEEHYRQPVLAFYAPTTPLVVLCCSRSGRAGFWRVYSRFAERTGVLETGQSYVRGNARPVVLWQPPATMVRLWPLPDRPLLAGQSYVVDAGNLAGYYSYPYDRDDVDRLASDPVNYADYAIVPPDKPARYIEGGREYPYVNRFFTLTWEPGSPASGV